MLWATTDGSYRHFIGYSLYLVCGDILRAVVIDTSALALNLAICNNGNIALGL